MHELREDILQFAWQHRLLKPLPLITRGGKEIFILKPGELNRDSGPDFFNAQVKTGNVTLAGNIEIHCKTSDWLKHKHQNDKNYDNIILHVVYENDTSLTQNTNNNVEVLELKDLLPSELIKGYQDIMSAKQTLACHGQLASVNDAKFLSWLERMFIERLEHKVEYIESLFKQFNGDYIQTFYTILLRNFGFKVNAVPFELLAKQLPVKIILKHADNLLQLEALLLGAGGLLEDHFTDKYILNIQNEFEYLKNKHGITPLKKELFKFSKLRPANFATLRLAQLAAVIHHKPELLSSPQHFNAYEKIRHCFTVTPEGYWQNHYNLEGNQTKKELHLGESSIANIITNTFSNFFFFYYKRTGNPEFENVSLRLMENCAFEKNSKTKLFAQKNPSLKHAANSQGLINLHDNYCIRRKCLNCGIAAAILSAK